MNTSSLLLIKKGTHDFESLNKLLEPDQQNTTDIYVDDDVVHFLREHKNGYVCSSFACDMDIFSFRKHIANLKKKSPTSNTKLPANNSATQWAISTPTDNIMSAGVDMISVQNSKGNLATKPTTSILSSSSTKNVCGRKDDIMKYHQNLSTSQVVQMLRETCEFTTVSAYPFEHYQMKKDGTFQASTFHLIRCGKPKTSGGFCDIHQPKK